MGKNSELQNALSERNKEILALRQKLIEYEKSYGKQLKEIIDYDEVEISNLFLERRCHV